MNRLRQVAQRIRHLPRLQNAERLWGVLRQPYQILLGMGGRGVSVRVGGKAEVSIPAEFAGGSWESHEPEAVATFVSWVRAHPGGIVLDIGSSIGIFSAVALFADPAVDVFAFDPDLPSLAAVHRMCQYASGSRLRLVNCFVSDEGCNGAALTESSASTDAALARMAKTGRTRATSYLVLSESLADSIPVCRLDDLLFNTTFANRPLLIKCDVEGSELKVLRGAEAIIRKHHPGILLSVHPPALPQYGCSKEDIEFFLCAMSYHREIIAVDHEEHWWCEFSGGS